MLDLICLKYYSLLSVMIPGFVKAFFRSSIAIISFLYGPNGIPRDFKSPSVKRRSVSKSICCF